MSSRNRTPTTLFHPGYESDPVVIRSALEACARISTAGRSPFVFEDDVDLVYRGLHHQAAGRWPFDGSGAAVSRELVETIVAAKGALVPRGNPPDRERLYALASAVWHGLADYSEYDALFESLDFGELSAAVDAVDGAGHFERCFRPSYLGVLRWAVDSGPSGVPVRWARLRWAGSRLVALGPTSRFSRVSPARPFDEEGALAHLLCELLSMSCDYTIPAGFTTRGVKVDRALVACDVVQARASSCPLDPEDEGISYLYAGLEHAAFRAHLCSGGIEDPVRIAYSIRSAAGSLVPRPEAARGPRGSRNLCFLLNAVELGLAVCEEWGFLFERLSFAALAEAVGAERYHCEVVPRLRASLERPSKRADPSRRSALLGAILRADKAAA